MRFDKNTPRSHGERMKWRERLGSGYQGGKDVRACVCAERMEEERQKIDRRKTERERKWVRKVPNRVQRK